MRWSLALMLASALTSLNAGHWDHVAAQEERPELLVAADKGDLAAVRRLVAAGANVDDTWRGLTALMYAAHHGNVELAEFLVQKGANVNQSSPKGESPLWLADRQNYLPSGHTEAKQRLVDLFVSAALRSSKGPKPTSRELRQAVFESLQAAGLWQGNGGLRFFKRVFVKSCG